MVRTQPLSPQPYTGTVEITSGEVAEDLAVYMAESEQTNSALALGVQLGTDGLVSAAGGYLIQVRCVSSRAAQRARPGRMWGMHESSTAGVFEPHALAHGSRGQAREWPVVCENGAACARWLGGA